MIKVTEVVKVCDRIIKLRITLSDVSVSGIFAYAPRVKLADAQKDHFYESLLRITLTRKIAMTFSSWQGISMNNGHAGQHSDVFQNVCGGYRGDKAAGLLQCLLLTGLQDQLQKICQPSDHLSI